MSHVLKQLSTHYAFALIINLVLRAYIIYKVILFFFRMLNSETSYRELLRLIHPRDGTVLVACMMRPVARFHVPGMFKFDLSAVLKRRTDTDAEYMEDGQDERIGATEYAEGNGTRKGGGKAERIT